MSNINLNNGVTLSYQILSDANDTSGRVVVTGLVGDAAGHIAIPAEIEGRPVREIGHTAFTDAAGLVSVEVPGTVGRVGRGAFFGCANLESLIVPAEGVEYDWRPFGKSPRLVVALRGGDGSEKRVRAAATQTLANGSTLNFEFRGAAYELVGHSGELPEEVVVTDTLDGFPVTSIASDAFRNSQTLVSVVVPGTVRTIGRKTFADCPRLEVVKLQSGLVEIGWHAFENCVSLREANLPPTLRRLGLAAFKGCVSLKEAILPRLVTQVNSETFMGCAGLVRAEAAATLKQISYSAFNGCTALETMKLPAEDVEIVTHAFDGCPKLRVESPSVGVWGVDDDFGLLYRLCVDGATIVGYVGELPKALALPETIAGRPVVSVGVSAFADNDRIVSAAFPKTLRRVAPWAFRENVALASLDLPDSVEYVDLEAFARCPNLVSVKLPKNLTTLRSGLFRNCVKLASVKAPDALEEIEIGAFDACASLAGFELPEPLRLVESHAFANCPLSPEFLDALRDKLNTVGGRQHERVGDALLGYENTPNGAVVLNYVGVLPAEFAVPATLGGRPVVEIGDGAFLGAKTLVSAVIPPTVVTIARAAFCECGNLEKIVIPASVSTVGDFVFIGCGKLSPQSLPETVKSVGNHVFDKRRMRDGKELKKDGGAREENA